MIKQILKRFYHAIMIRIYEKINADGVKYIFIDNKSDKLVVVFSGIGGDYNYRRSLKDSSWDQLYIKDSWASGLSYYLFENGSNHPEMFTSNFLDDFLTDRSYLKIVSLGSSKGGTAAIYFGLKHKFDEVFSGACQYKLGDYIGIYHKNDNYYPLLMGDIPLDVGVKRLNDKMIQILEDNFNSSTFIKLIYSTEEHTYNEHILPMLKKLDECSIRHNDQIEKFPLHSMIGQHMKQVCREKF